MKKFRMNVQANSSTHTQNCLYGEIVFCIGLFFAEAPYVHDPTSLGDTRPFYALPEMSRVVCGMSCN